MFVVVVAVVVLDLSDVSGAFLSKTCNCLIFRCLSLADHHINGRNAHTMFDYWLNCCPSQGSRVTRTEEAALVTLARLRPHIARAKSAAGGDK